MLSHGIHCVKNALTVSSPFTLLHTMQLPREKGAFHDQRTFFVIREQNFIWYSTTVIKDIHEDGNRAKWIDISNTFVKRCYS